MYLQIDAVRGSDVFKFNSRVSWRRIEDWIVVVRSIWIKRISVVVHCRKTLKIDSVQCTEREVLIRAGNEDAMPADRFSTLTQDGSVAFRRTPHNPIFEHKSDAGGWRG